VCAHTQYYTQMENNESIEQVLENLDKNIVYKTKDSVLWSIMLMLSGIISLIIYSAIEWESNNQFAHILFVAGSVFLIVGIIRFFFRRTWYISAEKQQKIKSFSLYFNVNERDKLVRCLESGSLDEINQLKPSIVDGLKLRVMGTKDGLISYSQVVAFISNEYVYVTTPVKHTAEEYFILNEIVHSRK
jgi:hypothetical protein